MRELKILGIESVDYEFEGQSYSFQVAELEDGYWSIFSEHDLFRVVNGSKRLYKVSSISEALQDMAQSHEKLATAMLDAFGKRCRQQVAGFCMFQRDRRMYYHFN
jgi:hypothetical protein